MLEIENSTKNRYSDRPYDSLTKQIIRAAIEVHRILGPGLLESVYEICLLHELQNEGLHVERQKAIPLIYKDVNIDCGYRLDLLVNSSVILELKSVNELTGIHESQMITYLKLSKCQVGLLINFNVSLLKNGIRRLII